MIQFYHVYKSYGPDSQALSDLTLEIDKGEFVYLTGPSGAGKSTLMKMVFGAERPTRGQLLVHGQNIARIDPKKLPALRRRVGVVFQDFKLLPRRTVEQNVAITLEILGMTPRLIKEKVYNMLRRVGLLHRAQHLPDTLSGGEQQRAAIARALINDPQILLADEPTGNLDAERARETMGLLADANARGTTVVVATHDRSLLERRDRRVIELVQGRQVSAAW